MNIRIYFVAGTLVFVAGAITGVSIQNHLASARVAKAETLASELGGRIQVEKQNAGDAEKRASDAATQAQGTDQENQRLRAVVAKLRSSVEPSGNLDHWPDGHEPNQSVSVGAGDSDPRIIQLQGLVEAQESLIRGDEKEIAELKEVVADKNVVIVAEKKVIEDSEKQSRLREIALQGQNAAINGALWRGRIEGTGTTAVLAIAAHLLHVY